MSIKVAYTEIVNHLQANKNVQVSQVLPAIIEMASAQRTSSASLSVKDTEGNIVALFCSFFKRWMPIVGSETVEFGLKASSSTGYNNMSKEGLSQWTKKQRVAKTATSAIIDQLENGEIQASDISSIRAEIEATRNSPVETDLGYAEKQEVVSKLTSEGFEV